MTDHDIVQRDVDAALEELRAAQPAADFIPRLRAHVETTSRSTLPRWFWPVTAAAVAIVVSFAVGYDRGARDGAAPPLPASAVPPPGAAKAAQPGAIVSAPRPVRPRVRPRVTSPDVLVPESERLAIVRLADALRAGRPEAVSMVQRTATADSTSPLDTSELNVAPIRIDPVVVPVLTAGVPISDR